MISFDDIVIQSQPSRKNKQTKTKTRPWSLSSSKVDADILSHDWLHDTCNRHDAARYSVLNGSVPA